MKNSAARLALGCLVASVLWPGLGPCFPSAAHAASLLLDDFESYSFSPTDADRDPSHGISGGWQVSREDGGQGVVQVLRDPRDAFNQTLQIANPAGQQVELLRSFERVTSRAFSSVVELRVWLRVDDLALDNEFEFALESRGGQQLVSLSLAPTGVGSLAGFSVRGAVAVGGAAARQSLVGTVQEGVWYELVLRADLVSKLVNASVRNQLDSDPSQSGELSKALYMIDETQSVDRIRFSGSAEGKISLDRVRVQSRASANLMRFGTFERMSGGTPEGWVVTRGADSRVRLDTLSPHRGRASLTLDTLAAGDAAVEVETRERIPVQPGVTYRVRYFRRVGRNPESAIHTGTLQVRFYASDGSLLSGRSVGGGAKAKWVEHFAEFKAPDTAATASIAIYSKQGVVGSVSADDISFTRMPEIALESRPGGHQFDFVEHGELATPGFTAVHPDKDYDPRTAGDFGWNFRDFGGKELGKFQRKNRVGAYPSFFQSRSVDHVRFTLHLPETVGDPADYRVSVYVGCTAGILATVNKLEVNGLKVGDDDKSLNELMDEDYFEFVRDARVDAEWLDRASERVYEDYVQPRFKRYDVTVPRVRGEIVIQSRNGCMSGAVMTPLAEVAAHDAALADFDHQLKEDFIARWAELLPTSPERGAKRGNHRPSPGQEYVLFARPWMQAVEYDSRPDDEEVVSSLKLSATPGEYEPVTFSIWPRRSLSDVRISVSSLSGPGGETIPASAVRIWALQHKPFRVRSPATDFRIEGVFLPDWHDPGGAGRALHKDMTQRVWLSVQVPADAKAGRYRGEVIVDPQGGEAPATVLPLTLRVRPFELERPKRMHVLRGGGGKTRVPYEDSYGQSTPGPESYASIGGRPGDSRRHEFYRKAALEDLHNHYFVPELTVFWPSFFDRETGETNWNAKALRTPLREWAQLIKDSPHGANPDLWVDAASINGAVVEAFHRASSWTPADVARFLRMLYDDLGPKSTRSFGGYRRLLLSMSAEESHYGRPPSPLYRGWLRYLDFVRNGDANNDATRWGNGSGNPANNVIQTVHTYNTRHGHADTVPRGLVDRPYLGMFHGVGEVDDLPGNGAQQIADLPPGSPFGLYGNRGRFVGGYYLWRAASEHGRFDELGTYHEFYNASFGTPNNDWDELIVLRGGHRVPSVQSEGPASVMATYSDTGRMIGTWFWEELREGVDDEAYLLTLQHWIDVSEAHPKPAVGSARQQGLATLAKLKDSIALEVDPALVLGANGSYLYRPIALELFDIWRDSVADATERLMAAAESRWTLAGVAEGGRIGFLLNGAQVSVPTLPGEGAAVVATRIATAIEARGIPAAAQGPSLTAYGDIQNRSVRDPGLRWNASP